MGSAIWAGYPNSYTEGRNRKPQYVVLHYTAGHEGPTDAENGVEYDKKRTDGVSTHYFTDSAGPALQEVPEGDRAHAARHYGNEIGIQIEVCGTKQTRSQWLDPTSMATLETTAWLVADICKRNGFPVKLLTVDETRAAYFASSGHRPFGITDHGRVTEAYPEDNGDHTDMGTDFPWDIFLDMVNDEMEGGMPTAQEIAQAVAEYVYQNAERGFPNPNQFRMAEIDQGTNGATWDEVIPRLNAMKEQLDAIQAQLEAGGGPVIGVLPHVHNGGTTGPAVPEE